MNFLYFIEGIRTPALTWFFRFCTFFGEEIFVLAVVCALYWCIDKKLAYSAGLVFFASGLAVQGLKITFRVDRPWIIDPNFSAVPSALGSATGYSFPSGHTQGAAALFSSLTQCLKSRRLKGILLRAVCILAICGVALSRMYLGVHTPADVAASLAVTVALFFAVNFSMKYYRDTKCVNLAIAAVLALLSAAIAIYAAVLYSRGIIEYHNVSDCLKSAGAGAGFAAGWYIEKTYVRFNEKSGGAVAKIIRFVIGTAAVLIIKEGLKFVLGENMPSDIIRYFTAVIWVLAIYPAILGRWARGRANFLKKV